MDEAEAIPKQARYQLRYTRLFDFALALCEHAQPMGWRGNKVHEKEKTPQGDALRRFGTPEGTRTPNIQNRNLTLYPIELRTHFGFTLHDYSRKEAACKGVICHIMVGGTDLH